MKKFSVGRFQGWLVGKMVWELRLDGEVILTAKSMGECLKWANYYHRNPEMLLPF